MQKIVKIEGMACPHCEAKVQKALAAVPGVVSAVASHVEKNAVVVTDAPVEDAALLDAVNSIGKFRALSVEEG